MDMALQNKVVLVAGGSYGIGFHTALQLAHEGAKVAILARNEEKLTQAAEKIKGKSGYYPLIIPGDVTKADSCKHFIQKSIDHFGRLDGLVIAAGASQKGSLLSVEQEDWDHNWKLNVMSPFYLIRESVPFLKQSDSPKIVVVGSASAKQPTENQLVSNVTKSGILAFVKTLAVELAQYNINVNNVCPGRIFSERREQRMISEAKENNMELTDYISKASAMIPLKRMGNPSEVAALITFLLSKNASYITGQSINVDGGLVKSII